MLPFKGRLECIRNPEAYSEEEVGKVLAAARANGLDVIPLVQTFGHLEYVLKHSQFKELREDPDNYMDLCPLNPSSMPLVQELIDQVP